MSLRQIKLRFLPFNLYLFLKKNCTNLHFKYRKTNFFFYFTSLMQHFCYMTCFYKLPKATSRRPKQNLIQTDVTFKIHVLFVSYLCSIFTIPLKKERTEQGVISTRCPVGVCITKAQIRNNFASPRVIKLKF